MKRIAKRLTCSILATLAILCAPCLSPAHADAVTDWNVIMQATVSAAPTTPFFQARWAAITQLSVFEAVNAIEHDYQPYLGSTVAPAWASPDAAAIAAAHRALVTLRPASAPALDAMYATSLSAIPDGPAKAAGVQAGEDAAAAMLVLRANDGSSVSPAYTPGTRPGDWQPTPPAFAAAAFTGWGQVTPFGLQSGSQFRSPPPPALDSKRYADDYNEVKRVGKVDSLFRPQDRTDVARFYGAVTPVNVFNPVARQLSAAQGKTLSENARIFALMAMAICDGSIAVFDTKYHYNIWRPVTAIRFGDLDGNRRTDPDPTWSSLIVAPAFPSYPSAHGSLSGGARAVLERMFGKHGHAITLANPAVPGVVLNYSTLKDICSDIDDARIYGGIHFRYDQEAGADLGKKVGKYILRNYLRGPLDDDSDDDE